MSNVDDKRPMSSVNLFCNLLAVIDHVVDYVNPSEPNTVLIIKFGCTGTEGDT